MGPSIISLVLLVLAHLTIFIRGSRIHYENPNTLPNDLQLLDIYLSKRPDGGNNQDVNKGAVGLWFGPRLGRRKRSPEEKELIFKLLQEGPWALVSLKDNKMPKNAFGRLGRESEETFADNMVDRYEAYSPGVPRSESSSGTYVGSSFTPRLGRVAPNEAH